MGLPSWWADRPTAPPHRFLYNAPRMAPTPPSPPVVIHNTPEPSPATLPPRPSTRGIVVASYLLMAATLDGKPFKQAIMEPTRLYVKNVLAALAAHPIKALAHITGGGLLENIPRVLPEGTAAHLTKGSWPQTALFAWLQQTAGIDGIEMNRTFNNGIGMVVVVDAANAEATAATLRAAGEQVYAMGTIAPRGDGASVVVA